MSARFHTDELAIETLLTATEHTDPFVGYQAIAALEDIDQDRVQDMIAGRLTDPDATVRLRAAQALQAVQDGRAPSDPEMSAVDPFVTVKSLTRSSERVYSERAANGDFRSEGDFQPR